jgi:hypothetical protein
MLRGKNPFLFQSISFRRVDGIRAVYCPLEIFVFYRYDVRNVCESTTVPQIFAGVNDKARVLLRMIEDRKVFTVVSLTRWSGL